MDNSPDQEMFINPRMVDCRDVPFPILSVVTCTYCGCLVTDTEVHQLMHFNHGHKGFGFK